MLHLAWQELRRRPGSLLGAMVMTAIGAALMTSFMVMYSSVEETRAPVERYAGVPVVAVGSPGMFTPEMVRGIAATEGVEDVVPELSFPVQMLTASGAPVVSQLEIAQFGHSWSSAVLTPFQLTAGVAPSGPDQMVVDQALARQAGIGVGVNVPVDVGGVVQHLTVSGLAESLHGPLHQHAIFFTPAHATELAGRGSNRVDAVGVRTASGTDPAAVEALIHDYLGTALAGNVTPPSGVPVFQVASGADRGELEGVTPDHRATAQAMIMLVWIVVAMAVVLVAGALVSSVRRRAAQIALMRAVGATPRQVRVLCQAEALLVAAAAGVIGVPTGVVFAWGLIQVLRATDTVSPVLGLHLSTSSISAAVLLVVAVTQAAAWRASRAALRTRPGDVTDTEPSTSRTRRRARARSTVGTLAIIAAGVVQAMGMAGAFPNAVMGTYGFVASLLIMVGVALIGSLLVRLSAAVARRPLGRVSPVSGFLAVANVTHHHRRYAGVTVPMTIGLAVAGWAMAGLPLFALSNAQHLAGLIDPKSIVVDTPIVREQHTGLSGPARQRIADSEGVTSAAGFREGWISASAAGAGDTQTALTWGIVAVGELTEQLHLGTVDGDRAAVDAGRGLALGRSYASRTGSTIGSVVPVRLPGATQVTTLPVVALYDDSATGDRGVIVAQRALDQAIGSRWNDYILVSGSASSSSVAASLAPRTVAVQSHDRFVESYVQGRTDLAGSPGTIGVAMVGGFLMLASVNALVLAHNDRLREFSALRRLSTAPVEARRMVAWEMALAVVPACLLGLLAVAWMAFSMAGADPAAAAWAYPVTPLVTLSVVALLIAIGASMVVIRGLQRRLVHGLRSSVTGCRGRGREG